MWDEAEAVPVHGTGSSAPSALESPQHHDSTPVNPDSFSNTHLPLRLQRHPIRIAVADVGGVQNLLYLLGICPPSEAAQCAVLGCLLQVSQQVSFRKSI